MSLPSDDQILALFRSSAQQQYTMKKMLQHFAVPAALRPAFRRRVKALASAGRLLHVRGSRYGLPERLDRLAGEIKRHEDGYGFLVPDDAAQADVYVRRTDMRGVMHGDRVLLRLEASHRREERRRGRVVQILDRTPRDVLGRVEMGGKTCRVVPVDARLCPDIIIPPQQRLQARSGQLAVAEIDRYQLGDEHPEGRVIEILGEVDDPAMEVELIRRKYGLPQAFPPEIEAAANAIPPQVQPHDLAGRQDLRQMLTFTIDGETARDFDDAVSLDALPNGHLLLGVHIADVSHYVAERSAIDREAYRRGTSVYFPDRVIPMLPSRLSTEVCCLQPEVDRLTQSVLMELTPDGEMVRYDMVESVICSQARLTYTRVTEYLDGNPRALDSWNPAIGEVLERMQTLAEQLHEQRLTAGSLDLEIPETEVVLDREGRVESIARVPRNAAHGIIEEFMLLANRTVARHLAQLKLPMLYRVHEPPADDHLEQFQAVTAALGYAWDRRGGLTPQALQTLLETVRDRPEKRLVNYVLLRALPRAHYAARPDIHFGLGFEHYTHFTSPIRRYPDLLVHRLLRDAMRPGGMPVARQDVWASILPDLAVHASARERLADDATREIIDVKKVEWMRRKIGEIHHGVISGVLPIGFFVELDDLWVEGLVHINGLPGAFGYHDDQFCLVEQHTGQSYRLGDRVQVRVDNANIARRQIDFSLLAKL
jgi:ribonuclease R